MHLDHVWDPAKEYIEHKLGVDPQREPYAFERYDPVALGQIVDTQFKLASHMKRQSKHIYGVLVIVDDMADNPLFCRQEKLLHQLFVRGRHSMISTIVSSQKVVAVAPIIRVNVSALFVFRLRSYQDLDTLLDEFSALVDSKKVLHAIYRAATSERFGFLYVDLMAHDAEHMFFYKFQARLLPEKAEDE